MKPRRGTATGLGLLLIAALTASCQKSRHEDAERYVFVATNVNLPYWQEAQAGFKDAAQTIGVKVGVAGPATY